MNLLVKCNEPLTLRTCVASHSDAHPHSWFTKFTQILAVQSIVGQPGSTALFLLSKIPFDIDKTLKDCDLAWAPRDWFLKVVCGQHIVFQQNDRTINTQQCVLVHTRSQSMFIAMKVFGSVKSRRDVNQPANCCQTHLNQLSRQCIEFTARIFRVHQFLPRLSVN